VLRRAERCLDGTLKLALAADQRGTTMTGICRAVAAAFVAAAATLQVGGSPHGLIEAAYIVAAFQFVAALIFAWSSRPVDFHVPGYEPRHLSQSASDEGWMLVYAATDLQKRIAYNRRKLVVGGLLFNAGMVIAGLPLLVGLLGLFKSPF
jgi:hypothetical protein